jgi:hypothetical protein
VSQLNEAGISEGKWNHLSDMITAGSHNLENNLQKETFAQPAGKYICASIKSTRVLHMDLDGVDNNESPVLSDIRHVLSSADKTVEEGCERREQLHRGARGDFHQYFDALNTEKIGIPLIAVKYLSTSEQTEDMPVGDKHETRKRLSVEIQFFDSDTSSKAAFLRSSQ